MRAAARDPASTAGRLSELGASEKEEIRRLVAQNPATPIEALIKLSGRCPGEVADNPALPLHLLADPGLLLTKDNRLAVALAASESQVAEYGARLALHPQRSVLKVLASNPALPPSLMEELEARDEWIILHGLASNPSYPPARLGELAMGPDQSLRVLAAKNPGLPAEVLDLLCRAGARRDLQGGGQATSPLSPRDRSILFSGGIFARELLAQHPDLPREEMDLFLRDKEVRVRRQLAKNPSLPLTLLVQLSQAPESSIRERVACHPGASHSLLEALSADPDPFVRKAVGRNPLAPIELVRRLAASDPDEDARGAMSLVLRRRGESAG